MLKNQPRWGHHPKPSGLRVGRRVPLWLQRLLALVLSVGVGADDCTQTLKTKCPLPFKSCNDCLTCTRDCCGTRLHDSPDLVCKPKERKAYCNSTAPPTPRLPPHRHRAPRHQCPPRRPRPHHLQGRTGSTSSLKTGVADLRVSRPMQRRKLAPLAWPKMQVS